MENFQYYTPTKVVFGKEPKIRPDSWWQSRGAGKCWSTMEAAVW